MRVLRQHAYSVISVLFALAASAYLAAGTTLGTDYANPICSTVAHGVYPCDDPGPSLHALLHGHLGAFFAHQPPMGPLSILLRAPFAELASLLRGSLLTQYRFGAFACLLGLGLGGLLVAAEMNRRGRSRIAQALVAGGFLFNPLTYKALYFGHPEELLAAGLTVAALLLAGRGWPALAGILLGGAMATKGWALLALGPVLLAAAPPARKRLLAGAGAVGGVLLAPMAIGNPHAFEIATRSVSAIATRAGTVTPANVWWPFAHYGISHLTVTVHGQAFAVPEPGYALPAALGELTHPLIIAVAAVLTVAYARRGLRRDSGQLLMLLALILLIRCVLDPFTYSYHHAPFLLALAAAEGLRRRGLPVLAALSALVLYLLSHQALSPATFNLSYLGWALGVGGLIGVTVFAPSALERLWPAGAPAPDPAA